MAVCMKSYAWLLVSELVHASAPIARWHAGLVIPPPELWCPVRLVVLLRMQSSSFDPRTSFVLNL